MLSMHRLVSYCIFDMGVKTQKVATYKYAAPEAETQNAI